MEQKEYAKNIHGSVPMSWLEFFDVMAYLWKSRAACKHKKSAKDRKEDKFVVEIEKRKRFSERIIHILHN